MYIYMYIYKVTFATKNGYFENAQVFEGVNVSFFCGKRQLSVEMHFFKVYSSVDQNSFN